MPYSFILVGEIVPKALFKALLNLFNGQTSIVTHVNFSVTVKKIQSKISGQWVALSRSALVASE